MPANIGQQPDAEAVDIRFRNGVVKRGVDPRKYRWTIGDRRYPPDYAYDIVKWQSL
jgi:hypothetical protein